MITVRSLLGLWVRRARWLSGVDDVEIQCRSLLISRDYGDSQ